MLRYLSRKTPGVRLRAKIVHLHIKIAFSSGYFGSLTFASADIIMAKATLTSNLFKNRERMTKKNHYYTTFHNFRF